MKLQTLARQALSEMEIKLNINGDRFVLFKVTRDQWMSQLVRHGHGGMVPDDLRFLMVYESLSIIADADRTEDLEQLTAKLAPDLFSDDLAYWVSSRTARAQSVNDAMNFGPERNENFDLMKIIARGQLAEKREVFVLVLEFLQGLDEIAKNGILPKA